jgi:hypothetical protein
MSSNAKRLWVINLTNTILYNSLVAHGGIQEMNLLPVFQIQLNRIRVALDFMLQAKYTAENWKITRLDGLEKALIATLEKERLLYMEQNMFLVRLYKTIND